MISITMFAGQDVAKMTIVRVSVVIKARDCVYQVIPKIKQTMQWSELLWYAVCKVNDDCKLNNTKCDQQDHICKPSCTGHEDCNSIPCDTVKGVCDPSKIQV